MINWCNDVYTYVYDDYVLSIVVAIVVYANDSSSSSSVCWRRYLTTQLKLLHYYYCYIVIYIQQPRSNEYDASRGHWEN